MASKSYFVVNIMEYLCDAPMEEILSDLCALYECPLNKDVESFLKKSAVDFAKKHQAVSYLVFSQKNGAFLGYFSLAIKTISVKAQNVSRTVQRKLSRMSTLKLLDFYCKQNHFVEFGTRNAKATDKTLLQLLKTI
jgi:hypothetical protein